MSVLSELFLVSNFETLSEDRTTWLRSPKRHDVAQALASAVIASHLRNVLIAFFALQRATWLRHLRVLSSPVSHRTELRNFVIARFPLH